MSTFILALFIVCNVGIVAGYAFLAFRIAPRFIVTLQRTKWGGVVFFFTCALTHLHLALQAEDHFKGHSDFEIGFSTIVHLVQVFAVWVFISGLFTEYIREKRRFDMERAEPTD